jgi:hypothetical protein
MLCLDVIFDSVPIYVCFICKVMKLQLSYISNSSCLVGVTFSTQAIRTTNLIFCLRLILRVLYLMIGTLCNFLIYIKIFNYANITSVNCYRLTHWITWRASSREADAIHLVPRALMTKAWRISIKPAFTFYLY